MTTTGQGAHSLGTIIKRLEAVTSRLEDVANSQSSPVPASSLSPPTSAAHDTIAGHIGGPSARSQSQAQNGFSEEMSAAVQAYLDEITSGALTELIDKSREIGGPVEQLSALLRPLCSAQGSFLQMASSHDKPPASGLAPLLNPQADAIQAIIELKDKLGRGKEGREWGACLSVIGEGVSAWGWVQVEPAPAPFIAEMKNAAQFWADRVIKQFKETNLAAIAWAKAFITLVDAMQRYVKQYHSTGVTWNPKGSPAPSSITSAASAPAAGGPPPPPPPPPADFGSPSAPAAGGPAALLAELNRGGSVTSGLRKVDPSQMTHKNPDLRSSSVAPDATKSGPPAVKAKPGALTQAVNKPPKMELQDGNKWIVEYQENNKNISIDDTQLNQVVQIYGCNNSVIKVSGKINAITMVACKKTAVVVDSAVSSFSITSSPSFEVQINGTIPTIQIDTTDSGSVYLSKECMEMVEIITSKTSSINISVPTGEGGDFEERPVPEQMRSRVVNGKLITEIVEHSG